MIGALLILAGYVSLVWMFGWLGVGAVVVHVLVMAAALPRK